MKNSRTKRSKASILKQKITSHINSHYTSGNPNYSLWYVGITNNTSRRKAEHKRIKVVKHWKSFDAGTVDLAHEIETFYSIERKTNNASTKGNTTSDSRFVYVFKFSWKQNGLSGYSSIQDVLDELFS